MPLMCDVCQKGRNVTSCLTIFNNILRYVLSEFTAVNCFNCLKPHVSQCLLAWSLCNDTCVSILKHPIWAYFLHLLIFYNTSIIWWLYFDDRMCNHTYTKKIKVLWNNGEQCEFGFWNKNTKNTLLVYWHSFIHLFIFCCFTDRHYRKLHESMFALHAQHAHLCVSVCQCTPQLSSCSSRWHGIGLIFRVTPT